MRWWVSEQECSNPGSNLRQWPTQPYTTGAQRSLFKSNNNEAVCQWQDTNDMNTKDNEKRIDKRDTNELTEWDFQLPRVWDKGPSSSLT